MTSSQDSATASSLKKLVVDVIREYNTLSGESQVDLSTKLDPSLYGVDSPLDSLGLVSIIMSIEDRIRNSYGIGVTLADDRAVSAKNSPFRSVDSLVSYINRLLELERGES
jgi:acyl carrier protein